MSTTLDDQLLANLMAAGSTDVVVGLPTRNHERTVGSVVQAVLSAFEGPFIRQRTLLLNVDAGSNDNTLELLQSSRALYGAGLRSLHQITTVLSGLPTRNTVLKLVLTASDLLRARAVVILDPSAAELTSADVELWVRSVLDREADYVKPVFGRGELDGPLVTQLLRPLLATTYGFELSEPVDTQLALSGRFAAAALRSDFWGAAEAEFGVDAFLSACAMNGQVRLRQVATQSRGRLGTNGSPTVSDVFEQLVGATFSRLASDVAHWLAVEGLTPVPLDGQPPPASGPAREFSGGELVESFRLGVDALAPLLGAFLPRDLLLALTQAANAAVPEVSDELWASVVFAFVRAAAVRHAPPRRLAQMLEPLYFGRLASQVLRPSPQQESRARDPLMGAFSNQKSALARELRLGKEH